MGTFRFLTAGESHGPGLVTIVEGVPAGLPLTEEYLKRDMSRRQVGYGRGGRMQIEQDWAEIRSGVRHGLTLGSPIALLVENRDWATWTVPMAIGPVDVAAEVAQMERALAAATTDAERRRLEQQLERMQPITHLRPGHADTTGMAKYFQDDARNILERSSARESAARVAAGAVARRFLEEFGMEIHSHVVNIGGVRATPQEPIDWARVEASPVRCADPVAEKGMMAAIDAARADGDSLGGVFEVIATGAPIGLGSHIQWDRKLSTRLTAAVGSLNAVKGVEFGLGFGEADVRGSRAQDVIKPVEEWEGHPTGGWVRPWQRRSNNAGGLEGGITTGEPLVIRAVVKPIATLISALPTVDLTTGEFVPEAHYERSDITFVPTCGVIGEAMVAIVLADAVLEKFGGDHIEETLRNFRTYMATIGPRGRQGGSWPIKGERGLVTPKLAAMDPVEREALIARIWAGFGSRPDLPPGEEYVRQVWAKFFGKADE